MPKSHQRISFLTVPFVSPPSKRSLIRPSQMEVPKRILVDDPAGKSSNGTNHCPADFYSDSDDDYDYSPPRVRVDPTARLMSPPEKLTLPQIKDEERQRYMRDNSFSATSGAYAADDSMYKTPNDTVLRNMNSFQSGDPVSLARQVRHLHNRVKLLEEELQTQYNRQIFLFGIFSVYLLSKGVKMMFR